MSEFAANPVSLGRIQRLPGANFLWDSKPFVTDEVFLGTLGRESCDCFGILDMRAVEAGEFGTFFCVYLS